MAEKILIVDDFDGETEAVGRLPFFVDGVEYELDLSEENMAHYMQILEDHRKILLEMAENGRPVKRQAPVNVQRGRTKDQLNEIRRWARANGHVVNDMGRVPDKILDAYESRSRLPEVIENRESKSEVTNDSDGK